MVQGKLKTLAFRRRRQGRTNYRKRLRLLLSEKPRLVVRKSLKYVHAQIITYAPQGDVVFVQAHSRELRKLGWEFSTKNVPAAYLTGFLLGVKTKDKHINAAILDLGIYTKNKGNKLFALLQGAVDGGLTIPHSPDILPAPTRINGNHIQHYAHSLKENTAAYAKQFSGYARQHVDPENISAQFAAVKAEILKVHNGKEAKRN